MEAGLPDFCSLRTTDLLGLALDGFQAPESQDASQDLVEAGAGAVGSPSHDVSPRGEVDNAQIQKLKPVYVGSSEPDAASAAILTTQELDLELLRLPLESEPQPGSELQPGGESQPQPFPEVSHVSATQSNALRDTSHVVVHHIVSGALDSAALDDELRAQPLETQDTNFNALGGAGMDSVEGDEAVAAADAQGPGSIGTGSDELGDGCVYMDSQALNDELRALPFESIVEDLQPPLPLPAGQGGSAAEDALAIAVLDALAHGDLSTEPQPGPNDADQVQHRQEYVPRDRPATSGWEVFDDMDSAGALDIDLEDYLAAQAADAQQAPTEAPPLRQLQPSDLDELDDLIAELQQGGAAPSTGPSGLTAMARAQESTSSQRGEMGTGGNGARAVHRQGGIARGGAVAAGRQPGRSQETVHQGSARHAKRAEKEPLGRPTMAELFGSDDEEEAPVVAKEDTPGFGRAAVATRWAARERAEKEEKDAAPLRSSYFPPQRLASSIQGGIPLSVTAASGERVYCRIAESSGGAEWGALSWAADQQAARGVGVGGVRRNGRSCLLEMPLSDMLRELEDRQLRAAVAASEREEERRRHQRHVGEQSAEERSTGDMLALRDAVAADGAAAELRGRGPQRTSGVGLGEESMLWVDKYAPRHFMSLLSDERTNRQVALWVKDWDACVFGRSTGAPGSSKGGSAGRKVDSRPQHKVLLIGGPPGLGKTTLAHVVAKHCGYHPYEINASDDRTASTLLTRIQDAVQMTSVLGGGRPNCVIVDEIDGATGGSETGGAMAALLKLVRAGEGPAAGGKTPASDGDADGSDSDNEGAKGGSKAAGAKRSGRKGAQQQPLCRPIICICNDLYAPALRPLRDVARVFHFSPPASERLTARLEHICQAERLEADPAALRLLVERTDRDVRACLNTLQFLARRGASAAAAAAAAGPEAPRRTIEVKDIESLNIASKDTTQSAMDMWTLLLSMGAGGRKRGNLSGGSASSKLVDLCNRLQDFGDYDLVLAGLHENLPRVRFMDINLSRTAEVEEAMGLADLLLRSCRRTGDFSSLKFVPPLLGKVRALAAQPERPRQLAWPRLGAEATRRASAAAQLVRSWASGRDTDPSVISSHGIRSMMLDLAPALRVLASQPSIRAVAPHMMTPDEQAVLRRTAAVMLHYGLRYCFESPTPAGLQPLHLPEVVAPLSSNAIILGLTAEVQKNIAAAGSSGLPGSLQRGGRGPSSGFQGGRGGSYGQRRGLGGANGIGSPPGGAGRGSTAGSHGPQPQGGPPTAARTPAAPTRHVPLVPAIDTLHLFTAFDGSAVLGTRVTVPQVVRQMISQQTEMEAIRRAEAARMAVQGPGGSSRPSVESMQIDSPGAGPDTVGRGRAPLKPVAPPQPAAAPQRQMAGRMPPPADGKKGTAAASGGVGTKRKGTWMDAFKQQASAKARGGVGGGTSAGAAARQLEQAAQPDAKVAETNNGANSPRSGAIAGGQGRLPFPVSYRFNEGYTNAVKRPLLMRELM